METTFRRARRADLEALVGMLADDILGARRENAGPPLPRGYEDAFLAIDADPNQELVVAERGGEPAGLLQITFIPSLSYQGGWRALIEGVRVAAAVRAQGVGRAMLQHAIERARQRGCHMVQLTADRRRRDAVRFYESLGFESTHEGLKLFLG